MRSDNARLEALLAELSMLDTEAADFERGDLDLRSTIELVREMNAADAVVPGVVATQADAIARAVDAIVERLRRGGRLIYMGAGTAGRIGVLDASECPPTFGTDPSLVVGLIAGGSAAIQRAVEASEDDSRSAATELTTLGLTSDDVVVGISASGRTPYVAGGLSHARESGALTIAVASNPGSVIAGLAEIAIEVVVGPEFLAGSTRLKSGTAQKLVLNMLSTLSMVRLGKTYRGVMVDLQATNEKLHARSVRTVCSLTGISAAEAVATLAACGGSVKQAILVHLSGLTPERAGALLDASHGRLRVAIAEAATRPATERM